MTGDVNMYSKASERYHKPGWHDHRTISITMNALTRVMRRQPGRRLVIEAEKEISELGGATRRQCSPFTCPNLDSSLCLLCVGREGQKGGTKEEVEPFTSFHSSASTDSTGLPSTEAENPPQSLFRRSGWLFRSVDRFLMHHKPTRTTFSLCSLSHSLSLVQSCVEIPSPFSALAFSLTQELPFPFGHRRCRISFISLEV